MLAVLTDNREAMAKSMAPYSVSLRTPLLTRKRMWTALAAAVTADAMQIALGPIGFVGLAQAIDVVAALLTISLLGFHPLLLPTFLLELLPVADLMPTWTGCVIAVLALRRRAQKLDAPPKIMVHPPEMPDKQA